VGGLLRQTQVSIRATKRRVNALVCRPNPMIICQSHACTHPVPSAPHPDRGSADAPGVACHSVSRYALGYNTSVTADCDGLADSAAYQCPVVSPGGGSSTSTSSSSSSL
jgi:hypothetical protein